MADLKPQLANFNWPDPFLLDNQLNEDDRMLRDAAAQFAQNELQPLIVDAYREATVNPSLFPKMGEAGLLGATIPEEYGGLGASYTAYGLIAREVERVDSGYRSMMSVQSSLVIYPIHAYGSEAQRQRHLQSAHWRSTFWIRSAYNPSRFSQRGFSSRRDLIRHLAQ